MDGILVAWAPQPPARERYTGWPSLWDTLPPTGEAKSPETATTVALCCIPAYLQWKYLLCLVGPGSALQLSLLEDTRGERWVLV